MTHMINMISPCRWIFETIRLDWTGRRGGEAAAVVEEQEDLFRHRLQPSFKYLLLGKVLHEELNINSAGQFLAKKQDIFIIFNQVFKNPL